MLSGVDHATLDFRELVDVTEAVLFEPAVHAGANLDEALDAFHKIASDEEEDKREPVAGDESYFDTPEWDRQAAMLEATMPPTWFPDADDG